MDRLSRFRYWEDLKASPRANEPKRLIRHGAKAFSQHDEDGIVAEIFSRIGTERLTFVEFGFDATENNTLALAVQGWSGTWLDADPHKVSEAHVLHASLIDSGRLKVETAAIGVQNLHATLALLCSEGALDLLSIDVDGNDLWLFDALELRPRVVIIEYNATWPPPMAISVPYDPAHCWKGNNYFGASLSALVKVGVRKGYSLVGCSTSGANAFFVRSDLCEDRFCQPYTAENHYEPPRYFLIDIVGHGIGLGPLAIIG